MDTEVVARRRPVAVLVSGLVVVALLAGGWWLSRPDALVRPGMEASIEARDDQPRFFGDSLVVSNTRPIELVSVRPVDDPPDGVRVTIVACRWRDPLGSFATGAGPLDEHCAETREVAGLELGLHEGFPAGDSTYNMAREWEVLAVVELGDELSYVTDGFVVQYREGLRRGRQVTGGKVTVHQPGHHPEHEDAA